MKIFLFSLLSLFPLIASAYETMRDVVYDTIQEKKLTLDVYSSSKKSIHASPALVYIHGGCFSAGSKLDVPLEVRKMADQGFVVFSVGYRLSTVAKYPAAVKDVQQAVRFIRKNATSFNIDPNKIITHGHSAGGYLASILGVRPLTNREGRIDELSDRVNLVANWYGRMDFTLPQAEGFDCAADFLGKKRSPENEKFFREASVTNYINEKSAAFHIVHGMADKQVYPIHSKLLYDALRKFNRPVEMIWIKNQGHGFTGGEGWDKTKESMLSVF
jgi:acetyl esterase/lipase